MVMVTSITSKMLRVNLPEKEWKCGFITQSYKLFEIIVTFTRLINHITILMKRLFLSLLAGVALMVSAFGQVPAPLEMTSAPGTPNLSKELSRKIGGKAFAKKTAQLPAYAREQAYQLTVTPKGYKVEANTETG